ncbi:hypothetical protein MTR_3g068060 [Medicago truncatula]|uniref:Uncharacterized protein n=1 Tax=Medicago truncatula TaxID=3880 RepID=A0A072V974_MEDTR|nr:hypothetical protein MTR_3g068060 [Medicago truncatula]
MCTKNKDYVAGFQPPQDIEFSFLLIEIQQPIVSSMCKIIVKYTLTIRHHNPFGVDLVVGLTFLSVLLSRSHVRLSLMLISVGKSIQSFASAGLERCLRKWAMGLVPQISRSLDRIPN